MCFNAEASFVGAAVVGAIGVATLTQVKKPREILFGVLPLAFAVHQFLEGMTWVELDGRENVALSGLWVHLWVLYAWALLPLWVPVAIYLIEPQEKRRRWLMPIVVLGAITFAILLWASLQETITVVVTDSNLDYQLPIDDPILIAIPYIIATCLSGLLSSYFWVRIFALGNVVALTAAAIIKAADFSSIWCTFAAFLSVLIFVHFRELRSKETKAPQPEPSPTPTTSSP